jgi:hypothetical protein
MIALAMATLPRTEYAVARSLAQTTDPRHALTLALRAMGESLSWRFGAVWEPAPDGPEALCCVETWHADGVDAESFERASRNTLMAAGEGLPGRVWQRNEPAWIPDLRADDNFPRAAAARRADLRAAFCFPLRSPAAIRRTPRRSRQSTCGLPHFRWRLSASLACCSRAAPRFQAAVAPTSAGPASLQGVRERPEIPYGTTSSVPSPTSARNPN